MKHVPDIEEQARRLIRRLTINLCLAAHRRKDALLDPRGVQVAAAVYRDDLALRGARALERAAGSPAPPSAA